MVIVRSCPGAQLQRQGRVPLTPRRSVSVRPDMTHLPDTCNVSIYNDPQSVTLSGVELPNEHRLVVLPWKPSVSPRSGFADHAPAVRPGCPSGGLVVWGRCAWRRGCWWRPGASAVERSGGGCTDVLPGHGYNTRSMVGRSWNLRDTPLGGRMTIDRCCRFADNSCGFVSLGVVPLSYFSSRFPSRLHPLNV